MGIPSTAFLEDPEHAFPVTKDAQGVSEAIMKSSTSPMMSLRHIDLCTTRMGSKQTSLRGENPV